MPDTEEKKTQDQNGGKSVEQMIEELKTAPITAAALLKWFEGKVTEPQKTALEEAPDVHEHLIPEKDIKDLEGKVKDSLTKQKEKLKSEFNNLLTQVNLKDPEAAQKMFPAEIRKIINDNPEFARDFEKANKEAEKRAAAEAKSEELWKNVCRALLLILGSPDSSDGKEAEENYKKWLEIADLDEIAEQKMKNYKGAVSWTDNVMQSLISTSKNVGGNTNVEKIRKDIVQQLGTVFNKKSVATQEQQSWCTDLSKTLTYGNLDDDKKFNSLLDRAIANKRIGVSQGKTT